MSCCSERILFDGATSMPTIFSSVVLDTPIHVKGDRTKPKITIIITPPAGVSFSFSYWIADINGIVLSDVKTDYFPQGTRVSTYTIGDWIDDQRTQKNIPPGMYLLIIQERYGGTAVAVPIFLVTSTIPITQEEYLEQIVIYDTTTGAMLSYPPSIGFAPADDRYMIFKYYHNEKYGRLVKLKNDGTIEWDTGWGKYVIIQNTLKFASIEAMLYYMFTRSVNFPQELILHTVTRISQADYESALKILKPYYRSTLMLLGRLQIEVDLEKREIREINGLYLGFWETVQKWLFTIIGSCVGGAVAGAIIGSAVPGVGTAVGAKAGCLIGIGASILALTTNTLYNGESKTQQQVVDRLNQIYNNAVNDMNNEKDNLINYLNNLLNSGIITKEIYDKIVSHVNKMYDISISSMKKLVEEGKNAYQEGYKKGLEDAKLWIVGAGLGGLAIGVLVGAGR